MLAVVDAIAWPALWVYLTMRVPFDTGLLGTAVVALAGVLAVLRASKALLRNERYRFTVVRWGRVALGLVLIGFVLKIAVGIT